MSAFSFNISFLFSIEFYFYFLNLGLGLEVIRSHYHIPVTSDDMVASHEVTEKNVEGFG